MIIEDLATGFRLGGWQVQPSLNRLHRGRQSLTLEPRVMDVLIRIAAAGGQPVGRADLLAALWPGVHVVDDVLTRCIYQLRKALGDEASLIETVRGRGYRITVPLQPLDAAKPRLRPTAWRGVAAALAIVIALSLRPVMLPASPGTSETAEPAANAETPLVAVRSLAEERAANIAANRDFLVAERAAVRPHFQGHATHAGTPAAPPAPQPVLPRGKS